VRPLESRTREETELSVVENLFIPLSDGCRLAARLWLPETTPAPAILEYIPYRKRDGTRGRDEPMHGYFAAHGYAALRVDMRGSGESDGLLADEYLQQELDDAVEVIAWMAAQEWCSGAVAMMGKSWGGFNAVQVAALRPPALKAVLTVCSTDDRYADDIHYMGGALLNDNLWWGAIMMIYQARPPDPALRADWRERWLERLDAMPLWPALWLQHQRRDAYWRHGSVCEDFAAITAPVFAVGGWADAYTNAVPRLMAGLNVPRLGLIGPWAHLYPQDGKPGPAIGFLQEALAWFDVWLRGRGGVKAPQMRAWVDGFVEVGEALAPKILELGEGEIVIDSPCWTGSGVGEWMGTGAPHEAPFDQRFDDGLSRCFDSAALDEALEILGAPELEFEIASDKPVAQIVARLCDISPDGASRRVSYGVLNLTHRDSHEAPEKLTPGVFYRVRLKLNDCGHVFKAGHKVRLALSSAYWPLLWPAPERAALTLRLPATLSLPRYATTPTSLPPRETGADAPKTALSAGRSERRVSFDLAAKTSSYETIAEGGVFGEGAYRYDEIDTSVSHNLTRRLEIAEDDPLSAAYALDQTYEMGRDGWRISLAARVTMRATLRDFILEATLSARENGELVRERTFAQTIPRDLV